MTETTDTGSFASAEEYLASTPYGMGVLHEKMGIRLTEVTAERIVATMPVEGNTQPYGLLHGGASCVLAEMLGSVGAANHGRRFGKVAVGVDINATHHRSETSGVVTGVATPAHLGRSSATFEIVISNEQGKRVCTARITCSLIDASRFA